jgi:hypothetical protein
MPTSKIIGYVFPVMPAFAILVGPWIATQTDRFIGVVVGASLCVAGVAAAAKFQPPGPPAAMALEVAELRRVMARPMPDWLGQASR